MARIYSNFEKVKFIKEMVELEGGCISLDNPRIPGMDFKILYVFCNGYVKDVSIQNGKVYDIDLADEEGYYVQYVFEEINRGRYNKKAPIYNILYMVDFERGNVEITKPLREHKLSVRRFNKSKVSVIYNDNFEENIFDANEEIIGFINEQILNNNYL